nr:retrovirus-related Pol polyprotein from transposon TNT 1-94 [Tanacetum cinerariifolium]
GLNIEEGNFNKLDDLVGKGVDYAVNEGSVKRMKEEKTATGKETTNLFMAGRDNENATNPPPVPPTPQVPHTISTIKLSILKKEIWEAIKSRFGGNGESKKMHKYILKQQFEDFSVSNSDELHKGYDMFQSLLSQLEIHGVGVSTKDANQKFFRSLPSSWSQVSLITRTKPGVDTLSFDDLYNNLRVFESGVKGRKLHFDAKEPVGFDKTKVKCFNFHNTRHFTKDCRSKGNQESRRRDAGNTGYKSRDNKRKPAKQDEHKAMITINGEGVDWTGHAEDDTESYALMAFNSSNSSSNTKVTSCSKVCEESYAKLKKLYDEKKEQLGVASIEIQAYTLALKKKLLAEAEKEKEELKTKLGNFQSSSKGLSKLLNSQMSANDKSGFGYGNQLHEGVLIYENEVLESLFDSRSSDVEDSHVNDRFAKVEGMHVVPPPMIGIYMPPKSDFGIDESKFTYGLKQSKTSESDVKTNNLDSCESNSSVETRESVPKPVESKPKAVSEPKVWYVAPIIEEYESDNDDEYVLKASVEQEKPINAARQIFSSQAASASTVKKVNTARPIVNEMRPRNNVYKSYSYFRRPFNRTTASKANFANHKVNTVGDKTVTAVSGNRKTADNPHQTLKGKGIVDSGCSRHMTGNKAYLVEYQDFNGGHVAFGAYWDTGSKTHEEPVDREDQTFLEELESLKRQTKEADDAAKTIRKTFAKSTEDFLLQAGAARASSINYVNTAITPVNTASTPVYTASLSRNIPSLEDIYEVPNDRIFTSASYDDEGAVADFANLESTVNIEPKKISQALEDESWVDAMQEELLQFKTQQVWILVDLPFGKKGHSQEERIDYDEVFALMARIEAIRIFLAFASYMGFIVYQMDVKSALLYGKIDEEVYVSQPPGLIDPKFPKKVYKVVKALYGLHKLSELVYLDDIIFGSTKKSWCDEFEALMKSRFHMSSMGELTFFLGLQVTQREDGIFISQDKYVAEILKKFDFMSVKTASTPTETHKPLVKDAQAADVDVHLYRSMIGSLMYLTASRHDIMYAVCACSRFQVTPKTSHLHVVKRIFRYLKGQPKLGLWYHRESVFDLEAYLDSDYAGANLDRKSITGEAEYVAAASCCGQILWI